MNQEAINNLLSEWKSNLAGLIECHYRASQILFRDNYLFGVPVVILSALVGTSVFTTAATKSTDLKIQIAIGSLSMICAILASLNAYLGYSKRAEDHRSAASKYSIVKNKIDQILANYKDGNTINQQNVENVREEIDKIKIESPPLNIRRLKKMNLI